MNKKKTKSRRVRLYGTGGYFYNAMLPKDCKTKIMKLRKYNPKIRQHEIFVSGKRSKKGQVNATK